MAEDESSESGVAVDVLARQILVDPKAFLGFVDIEHGIDEPASILAEEGLGLMALLAFGQVAHDRHHHIVQSHKPLQTTELVNHKRDVFTGFLKFLDELAHGHRGRHIERRGDEGAEFHATGEGEVGPE